MSLMGAMRPSELLAEMQSLCPVGEEGTIFLGHHFFLHLLQKILKEGSYKEGKSVLRRRLGEKEVWYGRAGCYKVVVY